MCVFIGRFDEELWWLLREKRVGRLIGPKSAGWEVAGSILAEGLAR